MAGRIGCVAVVSGVALGLGCGDESPSPTELDLADGVAAAGGTGAQPTGSANAGAGAERACAIGQTLCGSGCVDLKASPDHCGARGNRCGVDELCADEVGTPFSEIMVGIATVMVMVPGTPQAGGYDFDFCVNDMTPVWFRAAWRCASKRGAPIPKRTGLGRQQRRFSHSSVG